MSLCCLVNAVKSLCAHYLFNQLLEFDQTSTDTSYRMGERSDLDFGDLDLIFKITTIISTQECEPF